MHSSSTAKRDGVVGSVAQVEKAQIQRGGDAQQYQHRRQAGTVGELSLLHRGLEQRQGLGASADGGDAAEKQGDEQAVKARACQPA